MPNKNDDKLNKLLGRKGSIAERTRIAKELNDDQLQIAAPYIPQAEQELKRRRHERSLALGVQAITRESGGDQQDLSKGANEESAYINTGRIEEPRTLAPRQFDLARLIRLCEELNVCFKHECYFAVAILTRAVLDHVPPIFGVTSFSRVANNHAGGKSFNELMHHLEDSSRRIADAHLHSRIRQKEILPNRTQINFSNAVDVLLAEIVRILRR